MFKELLALVNAELAYEPAVTALSSAVAAFVVAVFAWEKAALAYEPDVTALLSAVAAFVVAVLACV